MSVWIPKYWRKKLFSVPIRRELGPNVRELVPTKGERDFGGDDDG